MENYSDIKIVDGDYTNSSSFERLILDYDGCTKMVNEFIEIETNGSKIVIFYDIRIEGHSTIEKGDELTPDFIYVDVDSVDIDIQSIEINDSVTELTSELKSKFEKIVKELI